MPTNEAVDGPFPYDLEINGTGYILARGIEPSLPFRTQRAKYGYTPTFIERQNVSGNFGDNQQEFWLTAVQNDWSLGEDQRYFDPNDGEKSRKYYLGQSIDVSVPGVACAAFGATSTTANGVPDPITCLIGAPVQNLYYLTTATHLFKATASLQVGTSTDLGAHGAAGSPSAACCDGDFVYFSDGATTRKHNIAGASFASYSAQGVESLLYLNNTIYGTSAGKFYTFASTGAATASFTFKDGSGAANTTPMKLIGLGGKVVVLRTSGSSGGSELWQWDGRGMSKLAEFAGNFSACDICVVAGIVFVIGMESLKAGSRTAIWYYSGGTIGRTWVNPTSGSSYITTGAAIIPFANGFGFTDMVNASVRYYDLGQGAVSTQSLAGAVTIDGTRNYMATIGESFAILPKGATSFSGYYYASRSAAFLLSSLIDFDSSLQKFFRGVTLTWDIPTGATGTPRCDVAYAVDGFTSYTTLATNATSGTEYQFPASTVGHSISIKVSFNSLAGTSYTASLRKIAVRGAPIQTQFRNSEYILDMSASQGETATILRNGLPYGKTGREQLDQLLTDILSSTPLTVIDRIGTYTGIAELGSLEIIELKPEQFYVRLSLRGV